MKKGLYLSVVLGLLATCGPIGTLVAAARDDLQESLDQKATAPQSDSAPRVPTTRPVKITDSLFTVQREEDLWFVAEKVSQENYGAWQSFVRIQENTFLLENSPFFFQKRNAADPLSKFKDCLHFFDKSDAWVMYGTNTEPKEEENSNLKVFNLSRSVEIFFACLTQKDAPFQLHMGITRNFLLSLNGHKTHEKISIDLHSFAVEVMSQIEPKIYVISTPLPKMTQIFKKALQAGTYFECNASENSDTLEDPISYKGSVYDKDFSFTLRGPDNSKIFSVGKKEAGSQYWWFFSNVQPSEDHPYFVINIQKLLGRSSGLIEKHRTSEAKKD